MPRPLRIFHLIKSLGRGGAEMLLSDGPAASDSDRFRYGFGYFLPHKDALVEELSRIGPVTCFPAVHPARLATRIPAVARRVKEFEADVVHCHLPLAGVVGRLAGRLARVPVVYTEHNAIERYHPGTRLLAKASWPMQRHVIAVSADVAASVHRHFGERVPVTVVRNGVSVERFQRLDAERAATRTELGLSPATRLVGSVAVFRTQKRLDLWLQVARRVCDERGDAHFVLVGDGPLMPEVRARIADLRLTDHVTLTGLRTDVRRYLAAMDVYLMTSDFEGVPIALLEAMAMAAVPVATDAGGIPEVVEHGTSGFVLPKGDIEALATSVLRLLALHPMELAELGARSRSRVEGHFGTRRMMAAIEELYERVV